MASVNGITYTHLSTDGRSLALALTTIFRLNFSSRIFFGERGHIPLNKSEVSYDRISNMEIDKNN